MEAVFIEFTIKTKLDTVVAFCVRSLLDVLPSKLPVCISISKGLA